MSRLAWILIFLALSCSRTPSSSQLQADASIAPPEPYWSVSIEAEPAQLHPLNLDGVIQLRETSTLTLRFSPAPEHYRVRLLDESDRVMPSDDAVHEKPGSLDYVIQLRSPLLAEHIYSLRIDSGLTVPPTSLKGFARTVSLQVQ